MNASMRDLVPVIAFVALAACSDTRAPADSKWAGFSESGKASYYGPKFQSKKTASGELYDGSLKTAAHRKLPFGTEVRVTNTENGESVIVRINDRGPFVEDRVVDLSRSAFRRIADLESGVVNVKIEVVE